MRNLSVLRIGPGARFTGLPGLSVPFTTYVPREIDEIWLQRRPKGILRWWPNG
jgi:hypothetical protein